jgi:hypothetical protein
MDIKKVGLIGAIILAVLYIGGSMVATKKAEKAMHLVVAESQSFGVNITYGDLSASVFGSVAIDELVIDTTLGKVLIDELFIDEFEQDQNVITELALKAEDISVSGFPLNNAPKDLFEAFVYLLQQEGNEINLAIDLDVDVDDDEAELETLYIEGDDIGEIKASLTLGGLKSLQKLESQSALVLGTVLLQELVVKEASLFLEDDGILDALLETEAKQKGVTVKSLRDSAIERGKLVKSKVDGETEKLLAKAGIALLEGDSITLTLDEETPIRAGQLFLSGKQGMQRELEAVKFDLSID